MTTNDAESNGKRSDQLLSDIVHDADDYYHYLTKKHLSDTRLDTVVVSLVVWFASFVVLGVGAITTIKGSMAIQYLLGAFVGAVVIAVIAGLVTFMVRRKRGFKFAELGTLLGKMKQDTSSKVSTEEGLHLMDMMQQASLVMKKRKLDSAFKYGVLAFAIVALVGLNASIGALAGLIVYLYYRFETLREYEKEEKRFVDSKQFFLQSL